MGLVFFIFGLNGFFHFLTVPPMPEKAMTFMGGLMASGYFFPLLKTTEMICSLMLLSGAFVPLALVVLAPVILNIFLFHTFLAPSGIPMALILGSLEIYLAFFSKTYSPIVKQIFRCPMYEAMNKKR